MRRLPVRISARRHVEFDSDVIEPREGYVEKRTNSDKLIGSKVDPNEQTSKSQAGCADEVLGRVIRAAGKRQ